MIPMYDAIIIGAGPAGLSAAITSRKWDLHVLVIDEFPKPGGRLLGQLHQEPDGEWWNGIKETEILLDQANRLNTDIRCGISAHHIEQRSEEHTSELQSRFDLVCRLLPTSTLFPYTTLFRSRKWDLHVLVIDEFPKPGGRLLGQLHQEPDGEWWNGIKETEILLDQANRLNTDIRCGISAHHIEQTTEGFSVHTNDGVFKAENILIATGAAETAAPVPGWTLPGVMSIGAAQVMTNVHRVRVGQKGIIIGVNVLSAAIARELQLAGVGLH